MKRNPLLLLLLLLIAAIAVGDCFCPYAFVGGAPQWPDQRVTWKGVVTQVPRTTENAHRCVVRLVDDDRLVALTVAADSTAAALDNTMVALDNTTVALDGMAAVPKMGDVIAFNAHIAVPKNAGNPGEMDYAAYLRHQGILGQAFCAAGQWRDVGRSTSLRLHERMLVLREGIVGAFRTHFDGDALAIVSAMTLGDRSEVDLSLRELYNRSGASHLLALSGLHLGILFGILVLALIPLRSRWGRAGERAGSVVMLVVLWIFVWLAGLPHSLLRAAVMFSVVTLLRFGNRRAAPFHPLLLTLFLLLLWHPVWVFDVGLQLSVVAVAAIIWVTRLFHVGSPVRQGLTHMKIDLAPVRLRIEDRTPLLARLLFSRFSGRLAVGVVSLVGISFVAQVATLPLVAHYFGRISIVGFLTSVVAIPAAYVIIIGALAYLVLVPWRGMIAAIVTWIVDALHSLMNVMASLPCATFDVTLSWVSVVVLYVLLLWVVHTLFARRVATVAPERRVRHSARFFRIVSVVVLTMVVVFAGERLSAFVSRPTPRVVIYNRTSHSEIHLVTPAADSVLTAASPHRVGNVVLFAGQRVAVFDSPLPYVNDVAMPEPLEVDVLLVSRGAKGHLGDALRRYRPMFVALDGCLSSYYRERFTAEAAEEGLSVYDIREQGALTLSSDDF